MADFALVGGAEDPWSAVSPHVLEGELRPLLKGVRLVAELDLSLRGEIYGKARSASGRLIERGGIGSLHVVCPSALVVFLVAEGVHRYAAGTFWPNVSVYGLASPLDCRDVGLEFLESLRLLGLETFDNVVQDEKGLSYVTPILLHGGIPAYCATDLWACLLEEMSRGEDDAGHLLARWRRFPYHLDGVDKPVRRFILHGGDFAVDLIRRMMLLADDVGRLGKAKASERGADVLADDALLPRYLAVKLLEGPREPSRLGPRAPRPRVVLDSYSGDGPLLILPSVPGLEGRWRLSVKGRSRHFRSSYEPREVPLVPATRWEVTFLSGYQTDLATNFAPMDGTQVYVFQDSGNLARNQRHLQGDSVLVLAPRHVSFFQDRHQSKRVREFEELPPTGGAWSGWQPRRLDLGGLREFIVTGTSSSGDPVSKVVQVREPTRSPCLLDDHLSGIVDGDGGLVFGRPPRLRVDLGATPLSAWRVRFKSSSDSVVKRLSDLASDESDESVYDLSPLFPPGAVASGVVEVLGPLGSDFGSPVTIVPGMEVPIPDRIIAPDEHVVVRLSADVPLGSSGTDQVEVDFPAGKYQERVSAGSGPDLLLSVPRIVWALRRRDGHPVPLGSRCERLGLDEFENGDIEAVLVRVGRPSQVRLELHSSERLQASEEVMAGGVEGRRALPVAEFGTTAVHTDAARLYLRLVCGDVVATVAQIDASYEVAGIEIESTVDTSSGLVYGNTRWRENTPFRNREIRLWSNHRPWQPPTLVQVPHGDRGHCEFEEGLAPGPYLLEIALTDGWEEPLRPVAPATNVAEVTIGTGADLRHHLSDLKEGNSLEALELEMAGRGPVASMDEESVGGILEKLKSALVARCREAGPGCAADRVYTRLSELSLIEPAHLAEIVSTFEDTTTQQDLARILVTLVQGVLDCAPKGIAEAVLERLWRMSTVAGAAFDRHRPGDVHGAPRCSGRWISFTGWDPSVPYDPESDSPRLEQLEMQLLEKSGFLDAHKKGVGPSVHAGVEVLRWKAYFDAAIEFRSRSHDRREQVTRWQSRHAKTARSIMQLEPLHRSLLQKLDTPSVTASYSFPKDLLACAFNLLAFGGNARGATRALWDAVEFAPELTDLSLVVAIVVYRIR